MGNTKQYSFIFFSFVFLILSFSLVSAAPPVLSTTQTGALEILAPTYDHVKQGLDKDIYWHVFNTTQVLSNTSVTCDYHLYSENNKGEHLVAINGVKSFINGRDFEAAIKGGNFSNLGSYCHLIECNSSIQAGGIERCFEVTATGEGADNSKLIFLIIIYVISFALLGFAIYTKDIPMTMIGGFALTLVGLFTLNNGIEAYRNFVTEWLSILTIMFGGFWSVKAGLEGYLGGW